MPVQETDLSTLKIQNRRGTPLRAQACMRKAGGNCRGSNQLPRGYRGQSTAKIADCKEGS